jgi:hypothetical protein
MQAEQAISQWIRVQELFELAQAPLTLQEYYLL